MIQIEQIKNYFPTQRREKFIEMTNRIIQFLERSGFCVETRNKDNPQLTAFRRNIHFSELLFDLGLSGHKEERFLIKIESQDQGIEYKPIIVNIKGYGFFFSFQFLPMEFFVA